MSPATRISVIRLSAIHSARLRSRSSSTLLTVSPIVLKTASMPIATIASATTTSISVKPRSSGFLFIAPLDFDAAVEAADERDTRARLAHEGQAVRRHLAAAPGNELRDACFRVLLMAQQDRLAFDDELKNKVRRQFVCPERGVPLDGFPVLLESVEALEFVTGGFEHDAVVAALQLR